MPELPSQQWSPISKYFAQDREAFPLHVPDHMWVRLVADASRPGLAYLVIEAFWIAEHMIHKVQIDEHCIPGADVPADDGTLHLVEHERISLERLEKMHLHGSSAHGIDEHWIDLTGDGRRDDLPTFLIWSHIERVRGRPCRRGLGTGRCRR